MSLELPLAKRMSRMQRSTIREILKITARKDIISFAGGLPAPELFPLETFEKSLLKAMQTQGANTLQYSVTEGLPNLKEWMCAWMNRQGLPCQTNEMMFTNGSQQALDLIGKIFLDPNDTVIVENPSYLGAIQAFNVYQPRFTTIPMDAQGINPIALEKALQKKKPKFIYLVPTFQNPSGVTLSIERRIEILRIAKKHHVLIIEDDPYSAIRFKGQPVPSMYALAKGKRVVYLSTFSKILSPGIRLGWVLGSEALIHSLVLAKQAADLQPNTLIQYAVYEYCRSGHLESHIPIIQKAYEKRADCMLDAMNRYFPKEVSWLTPEGGMFVWCTLPEKLSATALFPKAIAQNVAYVTGAVFHPNGGGDNTLRLNFTNSSEKQIEEGIRRLGSVFKSAVEGL